jgi:hypothetical protein
LAFYSGKGKHALRRPSHEQLEDDVWLGSLKKTSGAGALGASSWSASGAFQTTLAIAVMIMLSIAEAHPLFGFL